MYYLILDELGECVFETKDKAERDQELELIKTDSEDTCSDRYVTYDYSDRDHFEAIVDGEIHYSAKYITPTP